MTGTNDRPFETRGMNHLALVCSDMKATVDFYEGVLGFPLVKTVEMPGDVGQHFFFDVGNGACLAFMWLKDAPPAAPGISSQDPVTFLSGIGSMNHIAIDIDAHKIEEYRDLLIAKGIEVTPILNHDDSERGASPEVHDGTWVRSIYFFDPDGIRLEFAGWTRAFNPDDVGHAPVNRTGERSELTRVGGAS